MSLDVSEGPCTSTSTDKEKMEAKVKALNLLAQGKRNLICKEIPSAVQLFQDACESLSSTFGEMASECADAYFEYGGALLELARMEQGVLGLALKDVDVDEEETDEADQKETEETNDESHEKLTLQIVDAMSEGAVNKRRQIMQRAFDLGIDIKNLQDDAIVEELKKRGFDVIDLDAGSEASSEAAEEKTEEGPLQTKDDSEKMDLGEEGKSETAKDVEMEEGGTEDDEQEKEDEDDENEEEAEDGEEMEEGENHKGDKEDEEADADEVSNLQLAWEMIELSRIIYNREGDKLKQAEAHLKLGEISLESEQFATAIKDFKTCLEIQLQNMEPCDRAIAETHYQIGVAQQLHKEHLYQAADSFRAALKCLELKIEKLKETIMEDPPTEPGSVYSPKEAAGKEIEDIEKILPEIKEKIKEIEAEISEEGNLKQMAKEAMGALFASNSGMGFSLSTANTTSSKEEKPAAMDINHLIRKKRKPEDMEAAATDDKKQRQTDAGDSTTNGHSEDQAGKEAAS